MVVTGATEQYGRKVIEHLLQRGVPAAQIAGAVRTPAQASGLLNPGVEVRHADYDLPDTLSAAFAGADKLLLVSLTVRVPSGSRRRPR
ncbi:NAD(P)H-binding protein [Streptomyces longwoodensis]|uniref:NAD(P)H-binding protein n=1 Tax=Streptomyces longwoodensis TaxID=68231 RepID=UPI0033CF41CB